MQPGRDHAVRAVCAGHSFGDIVLTEGTLISLERRRRMLDVDRATRLVRAEAGAGAGRLQPERPASLWNPKGYINNAWGRVGVNA